MTKPKLDLTKENLQHYIVDLKKTSKECAKEFKVCVATIRKAREVFGITESFAKKKVGRKTKYKL